jgi:hypothetical protein
MHATLESRLMTISAKNNFFSFLAGIDRTRIGKII